MHRSLLFDLILPRRPFQAAYFRLRLYSAIASCVSGLPHVYYCPSPAMNREKLFLARVEWIPVTSSSHTVTMIKNSSPIMSNIDCVCIGNSYIIIIH